MILKTTATNTFARISSGGKRVRIVSVLGLVTGLSSNESPYIGCTADTTNPEVFWNAVADTCGLGQTYVYGDVGATGSNGQFQISFNPATGITTFQNPDYISIGLPDLLITRDVRVFLGGSQGGGVSGVLTVWYELIAL